MPTNSRTVLLLLIITLCAEVHKSRKTSKKLQCWYTSLQHPVNSKVTIFIDSDYVMR